MSDDKESWLQRRAYQIWQEAGESHGQHEDHWHQAAREYDQAMSSQAEPAAPAGGLQPGSDLEQDLIETPPPADAAEPTGSPAPIGNGPGSTAAGAARTGTDVPRTA
jgi:hypothetical protein